MLASASAVNSATQRNVLGHVSSNSNVAAKTSSFDGAGTMEKVRRSDLICFHCWQY